MVSHFVKNPGPNYFNAINQNLRYLAEGPKKILYLRKNPNLSLLNTQILTRQKIIPTKNQHQDLFLLLIADLLATVSKTKWL